MYSNQKNDSLLKQFVLAICIISFAACTQNKDQSADNHAHDLEPIQYTAYSPDFEVFAEANPFVKDQSTTILVHFSHMESFKPLTVGKVVANLIVENKGIRQIAESPLRNGIYQFSLSPTTAGKGKLYFEIHTDDGIQRIDIPHIEVFNDEHTAILATEGLANSVNGIVFTKEQSWKIDFRTDLVQKKSFGSNIPSTGIISASPGNTTVIAANRSGIVSMPTDLFVGTRVKKGQILFIVSGNTLAENNSNVRYIEAKNAFETAASRLKRMEVLAGEKIVSGQDLINATSDYNTAKAVFDNLKNNSAPEGIQVTSPINGYISELNSSNGDFISAGGKLAVISSNDRIFLTADVSAAESKALLDLYFVSIHYAQKVSFLSSDGFKLKSIGQATNTDNFLVPVTLEIENEYNLVPGQIVKIDFQTLGTNERIVVPQEAILEEQGNYFVMVQITPEQFEKRLVKIGKSNGLETVITSGLQEGERLVTRGAIMVKLAQASGALDPHAGHVH